MYKLKEAIAYAERNGNKKVKNEISNILYSKLTKQSRINAMSLLLKGESVVSAKIIKVFKEKCGVSYEYLLDCD